MDIDEDPLNHQNQMENNPLNQQNQMENIQSLLALARQKINEGSPSQALQAVVMALKAAGGESAVMHTLHRARELYSRRRESNLSADQLASLFAECAITEASPNAPIRPSPFNSNHMNAASLLADTSGTSILAENGRMQIVMDAFEDGSSFICLQCGGLVSNARKDEHIAYWCSPTP
ncbi:hypothetical protein SUGI_0246850 [Cryptomeria japonica]|uniref:uncharacterized protein LOC131036019 n=1 Tax=Cryptomeria japonica TaxID=3369 RepID=UPI002408D7EE|nr:uncharacterized protein LOC131036019 [Cryptomeria japonica]GLJ15104.1 hypothetical protein SUGI_0246850 [Cryptomeria japonica]